MTTKRPPFTPIFAALPATVPFVGPEALQRARGAPFRARMGANESCFGPPPSVVDAIKTKAGESWKYSDPDNYELKAALAAHLGVDIKNVVVGEGIDGLLGIACRLFLNPGDKVMTSLGAYPTFNFHVASVGAPLITVPYRDDKEDLEGLLDAVWREQPRIVYLSNPDNPMGSWHTAADVSAFANALPDDVLLLLDEAYIETAPEGVAPPIDTDRTNVLRFRTFSKAYGLAGARVGYAIGDQETIAAFEKARNHYGVNILGQVAALAALADQDYLGDVVARISAGRARISAIARSNGLTPLPSATNFVTIDCGADGPFAKKVLDGLIARDIFVCKPVAVGLDGCIRVSVGLDQDIDLFAEELPGALTAARD